MSFYCGPKDDSLLMSVDPRLEQSLDYGWLSPLVKLILRILKFIYKHVKNYGLAIILLTLLIRLLLVPVTKNGYKALEKQKEYKEKHSNEKISCLLVFFSLILLLLFIFVFFIHQHVLASFRL